MGTGGSYYRWMGDWERNRNSLCSDRLKRVKALFTKRGCSIDDVDACVDLLRDERLRVEFAGLSKKSVADLYRDEKLNLISAKEKVRALIDQYIESQGIDPKVPPIDILSLDFEQHVKRHRSVRAQAAEMEFAARYHIDTHIDEDPVYYKNKCAS